MTNRRCVCPFNIKSKFENAFTLVELLVVIAIFGILAALSFPAINSAKAKAKRTACLSNLRQVNLGLRMYCDDSNDKSPDAGRSTNVRFKQFMKSYVGLHGPSSPDDRIFACPADTFRYNSSETELWTLPEGRHGVESSDYSSYSFNGLNLRTFTDNHHPAVMPGIGGRLLGSIRKPAKTILVAEDAAFWPYSWHEVKRPFNWQNAAFNDSKNVISFVDGHLSYLKMYHNDAISYPGDATNTNGWGSMSCYYDPPAGYDYQWSGD